MNLAPYSKSCQRHWKVWQGLSFCLNFNILKEFLDTNNYTLGTTKGNYFTLQVAYEYTHLQPNLFFEAPPRHHRMQLRQP